ncbi:MAG: hypothetical protein R6W48_06215 [Gaiellaceae bacterium]
MTTVDTMFEPREAAREAGRLWWLFLLTGIAWLVFSFIIFRFNITSAATIAPLFGVVAIVAGFSSRPVNIEARRKGSWRAPSLPSLPLSGDGVGSPP